MEEHKLYEFQIKAILDTLRICGNDCNSVARQTCLARMIEKSKRFLENALNDSHTIFVSHGGYNEKPSQK